MRRVRGGHHRGPCRPLRPSAPDRAVGDLPLMSESGRQEMLGDRTRIGSELRAAASSWPGGPEGLEQAAAKVYLLDRKLRLVPTSGEWDCLQLVPRPVRQVLRIDGVS